MPPAGHRPDPYNPSGASSSTDTDPSQPTTRCPSRGSPARRLTAPRHAKPRRWSEYAYGRAIDLNPWQNPYVTSGGRVSPPEGRPKRAFASIGWGWGGRRRSGKDYQHFSASGR